ncbi:DRTGG domain-containing protein [Anaerotalea alkaliphila]|uniref:DRTGG domain-containing protein n=1 Tax=Anaerotalea alkaliphila TaxID=2662126 RepID=A0A7X5HWJ8_9FIRM|nr:DRTGG domain-containing protein [Anaerotalea alkaliphila]NDL67963.1 hypothetical protein [Anaerotalea alkaliphila]
MTIGSIKECLEAHYYCGEEYQGDTLEYCYSCDLMSDVLAYVKNNVILLTGLVHPQVIRTAEMLDIRAIMIVRGKRPSEEIIEMAKEGGIVLMGTRHSLFTASGILFGNGMRGEEITHDENAL